MPPRKKQPNMQKPPASVEKPAKAIVTALSLADLAPRRGTVIVERPDDQDDLAIPYKELTYKRYWEIGRMVDDPPAHDGTPIDFTKDEKGELRHVYSINWTKYQQARQDVENQRMLMRLAEFVDLPFQSETLEGRAEELQTAVPHDVLKSISAAMATLTLGSESRVSARAAAFHGNGNGNNGNLPADGVVSRKALVESV